MKNINVVVKSKTILELLEDASKGDQIDLANLVELDTSFIEALIDKNEDKVYQRKLEEYKASINREHKLELDNLNAKFEAIIRENEQNKKLLEEELKLSFQDKLNALQEKLNVNELATSNLKQTHQAELESIKKEGMTNLALKSKEIESLYTNKINELESLINVLKSTQKSQEEALILKKDSEMTSLKNELDNKYSSLEAMYNTLKANSELKLSEAKLTIESNYKNQITELKNKLLMDEALSEKKLTEAKSLLDKAHFEEVQAIKDKHKEELQERDERIASLTRAKASLNIKQTGEDLEAWCNREVESYMQNGLFNCKWTKDNKVVRDQDEEHGSKADFIFRIYADNNHNENDELASICLDMKDENPDSVNKKTNESYFAQLEKNRIKKNCKYSLLVSNLERDKPNDSPITKAIGYENMYVVRPEYLMIFLNMITSLTTRFQTLILTKTEEQLALKSKLDLVEEFNTIKNRYLDKPLESLVKSIDFIAKSSESIKTAANKIDDECAKIKRNYISEIENKISRFELELDKRKYKILD